MAMDEAGLKNPWSFHVILFPFPASGHFPPFIIFAKHLARLGVAISFIAPTSSLSILEKLLVADDCDDSTSGGFNAAARRNINVIYFELPVQGVDTETFDNIKFWLYDHVDITDEIVGRIMAESATVHYPTLAHVGPPVCIIADMFAGFTQEIADKNGIARYILFTSPVHFLSLMYHFPQLYAEGRLPYKWEDEQPFCIPGFPPFAPVDLPASQYAGYKNPNTYRILRDESKLIRKAAGVLVNSVYELESTVIDGLFHFLRQEALPSQLPNILTIGPMMGSLEEGETARERLIQLAQQPQSTADACFKWLAQQPDASVIYVCFGSIVTPSTVQFQELALGLEKSGHRFLWALRIPKPNDGDREGNLPEYLPEGFTTRTKSRGIVYLEWAPQVHILAHRAIGGFISHCGWNSTMESICMDVPMIGMPIQADQMMNATLIGKLLGAGIRINQVSGFHQVVGSETIEQAVHTLMDEGSAAGDAMRKKVVEVRDIMERAIRPGGSSTKNLTLFLQTLQSLRDDAKSKIVPASSRLQKLPNSFY